MLGVGEKSGMFYTIDPDNGDLIWSTRVGPGGGLHGGMLWGSATDGETIYTASSNANNAGRDRTLPFYPSPLNPIYPGFPGFLNAKTEFSGPGFGLGLGGDPWTLVNPPAQAVANADGVSTWVDGSQLKTITGFWSALDAATGEILWQRPLPTDGRPAVDETPEPDPSGGTLQGSVTLANGVLFGGGADGEGSMFAMNTRNGTILFEFNAEFVGSPGGGIEASPAVVDGVVYWGSGASRGGVLSADFFQAATGVPFTLGGLELRNNKVYAFELPDGGGLPSGPGVLLPD
jgi:polyvinyl alcohol dehydrogenase (cytochrome)